MGCCWRSRQRFPAAAQGVGLQKTALAVPVMALVTTVADLVRRR
jgi:hypothetical protein